MRKQGLVNITEFNKYVDYRTTQMYVILSINMQLFTPDAFYTYVTQN